MAIRIVDRPRILELRKAEPIWVRKGAIYRSVNQKSLVDRAFAGSWYPVKKVTVLYLEAREDPVTLAKDIDCLTETVIKEAGEILSAGQFCLMPDADGEVRQITLRPEDASNILLAGRSPKLSSQQIPVINLVHLLAHIILPYAFECRDPVVLDSPFEPRERTFENQRRKRKSFSGRPEYLMVYNFPARSCEIGRLAGIILNFLELWVSGRTFEDLQAVDEKFLHLAEQLRLQVGQFHRERFLV